MYTVVVFVWTGISQVSSSEQQDNERGMMEYTIDSKNGDHQMTTQTAGMELHDNTRSARHGTNGERTWMQMKLWNQRDTLRYVTLHVTRTRAKYTTHKLTTRNDDVQSQSVTFNPLIVTKKTAEQLTIIYM